MPLNVLPTGGLFLPTGSYWGANAGKYLTVGYVSLGSGTYLGAINTYNADGTYQTLWSSTGYLPKTPALAPAGWGAFGGQVIVTDGGPPVYALASDGTITQVISNDLIPEKARFGLAFAPSGWGGAAGVN